MKLCALCSAFAFCFFFPSLGMAQNTGRIECARNDGYVYLYSSITTYDVRATLQCGDVVAITSRYDNYFAVRTAKGETGYVPFASIVILKDSVGTGLPVLGSDAPARERIHYDEGPRVARAPAQPTVPSFTLLNDTPVRMKLVKTISSATAHAGDPVEFEVIDDVLLNGVVIAAKGSKATGVITEADPKRRFGRAGTLAFKITSLLLADGEHAPVRCYQHISGLSNNSSEPALSLSSGKDAAILQDAEFTALVDGDVRLKREAFSTPKDPSSTTPASSALTPQP